MSLVLYRDCHLLIFLMFLYKILCYFDLRPISFIILMSSSALFPVVVKYPPVMIPFAPAFSTVLSSFLRCTSLPPAIFIIDFGIRNLNVAIVLISSSVEIALYWENGVPSLGIRIL